MPQNGPIDLFISACEPSADTLGEHLLQEIKKRRPHLQVSGVFGPKMRALYKEAFRMESFQVMGFKEVFFSLPKIISLFFRLKAFITENNPKVVLFIDYPEFHMKLQKSLRKKGFLNKLVHFVSPSVWAWRKKRADFLATWTDQLFTLFPFEKEYYSHTKLPVEYVGHPLVFETQRSLFSFPAKKELFSSFSTSKTIVIFPGSRQKEIEKNLTLQYKAAENLQKIYPEIRIAISCINLYTKQKIASSVSSKTTLFFKEENSFWMKKAFIALATSGTISLELALHKTPSIITYAVGGFDLFLAKNILRLKLPFYTLANILLKKEVFPELIGPFLTEKTLFAETFSLFTEEKKRKNQKRKCEELQKYLKTENPSQKVVEILFPS